VSSHKFLCNIGVCKIGVGHISFRLVTISGRIRCGNHFRVQSEYSSFNAAIIPPMKIRDKVKEIFDTVPT